MIGGEGTGMGRGEALGIVRIVASNPSALTGAGTNTYLLGTGPVAVVDPGPDDPGHLGAILNAVGRRRVVAVLVTHAHGDHAALARPLARAARAPVVAFGPMGAARRPFMAQLAAAGMRAPGGFDLSPDRRVADGDRIEVGGGPIAVMHLPGHTPDHLAFVWRGSVLTGDTIMGWSSTMLAPPDGDLSAYLGSLARLAARRPRRLLPGHGDPVDDPDGRIASLVRHRFDRHRAIAAALGPQPRTAAEIASAVYGPIDPSLAGAAEATAMAHLIDLTERGRAIADWTPGPKLRFRGPA